MKHKTISIMIYLLLVLPVSGYTSDVLVSGRPYLGKLQLVGEELFWTERGTSPINKVSLSGGPTTTVAGKLYNASGLRVLGDHMFWFDYRPSDTGACCISPGGVMMQVLNKTSLDGTITEALVENCTCFGGINNIITDGLHIYLVSSNAYNKDNYLYMMPLDGGEPVLLATVTGGVYITFATQDNTHIYWNEGDGMGGRIVKMPLGGGDITTILEPTQYLKVDFQVHDGFVYFSNTVYPAPVKIRLNKVPVSGGTPVVLAERLESYPARFAAEGSYLYWIDQAAALRRISVDGGDIVTLLQSDGTLNDLAVHGEYAYVAETPLAPAQGNVTRIPLEGGPPEVLIDNLIEPYSLTLDVPHAYWVEGRGGGESFNVGNCLRIGKAFITSGSASTFLAGIGSDSASIARDDVNIYIADGWNIKRVALDGSVVEKIARADFDIQDITTDGVNVYWIEGPFSTVRKVPVNGGPVTVIGGGYGPPGPVRVIDGYVYWMDHYDTIYRNSVDGNQFTTIASGLPFLSDMIVDGTNVYFSENDTGRIQKVPVNGGDITTLAYGSVYWMPYILAYDNDFVYWVNAVEVGKVSKDGGSPATLHYGVLSNFDYPNSIVVDGANGEVYWTEVGGGTINKGSTEPAPPVNSTPCKVKVAKAKKNHGDGVVMSHDGYINCGPSCSVTYQSESVITFTATANEGSTFIGWKPSSLNCFGTDPCMVRLRGNATNKIQAVFVGDYRLKVINKSKKKGSGTVTSTPSGISCSTGSTVGCEVAYPYAEQVTLSASADSASTFLGWSPSKLCPENVDCVVPMDRKRTIKAVFSGQ